MKGAVSAQKALQGSDTETRELLGGTEEKSVSRLSVASTVRKIRSHFKRSVLVRKPV